MIDLFVAVSGFGDIFLNNLIDLANHEKKILCLLSTENAKKFYFDAGSFSHILTDKTLNSRRISQSLNSYLYPMFYVPNGNPHRDLYEFNFQICKVMYFHDCIKTCEDQDKKRKYEEVCDSETKGLVGILGDLKKFYPLGAFPKHGEMNKLLKRQG